MFSPHLLHDLEKKIKRRNSLIKDLARASDFFADKLAKTRHRLGAEARCQDIARGDIPLLPEEVDNEESMDIICSYDGKWQNNLNNHGDKAQDDAGLNEHKKTNQYWKNRIDYCYFVELCDEIHRRKKIFVFFFSFSDSRWYQGLSLPNFFTVFIPIFPYSDASYFRCGYFTWLFSIF